MLCTESVWYLMAEQNCGWSSIRRLENDRIVRVTSNTLGIRAMWIGRVYACVRACKTLVYAAVIYHSYVYRSAECYTHKRALIRTER